MMEELPSSFQPPWYLEPYEGESISHYFGRYCRREAVKSPAQLSQAAGLGPILARWEKFRFHPFPSAEELEQIGALIGLTRMQLEALLPKERMTLKPIRLCAACYLEAPYHRMEWQYQVRLSCSKHRLRLLTQCPNCRQPFPIPSLWQQGTCQRCGMGVKAMKKRQRHFEED
jgi:hypothetical protein